MTHETLGIPVTTETFDQQTENIKHLPNGMRDMIAVLGSTHPNATFREGDEGLINLLNQKGATTMNTKIDGWSDNADRYTKVESEILATSSVLLFRIENKGEKNRSLGTLSEISIALFLSKISGQRVIVSIEDGIEETFENGAQQQYNVFEKRLAEAERKMPDRITVLRSNDLAQLADVAHQALLDQRDEEKRVKPISQLEVASFIKKRNERLRKPVRDIVVFGSSAPASSLLQRKFDSEQRRIRAMLPESDNLTTLNMGVNALAWNSANAEEKNGLYRQWIPNKENADIVLITLHDEAVSGDTVMEIGAEMISALEEGKLLLLLLEPPDVDLFSNKLFTEHYAAISSQVFNRMSEGKFKDDDVREAFQILRDAKAENNLITYERLSKNPILSELKIFRDLDNGWRLRTVASAQVKRIYDVIFPIEEYTATHLFEVSYNMMDYVRLVHRATSKTSQAA